ncbi:MAG: hypothetical protein LBF67_04170 [Prevotellaceae bacterium]|jgi:tryptophanyl-tRNA synthetase|nr:hypothetical protein [Prevotellaceae bacterium]
MAKLRNIIGCILNEFTEAQHLANNHAARLGKEYAENDLLRYFMIPNAYAGGLQFHLKFAVNPSEETETVTEVNYRRLIQFFTQLSVSVAETAITTTLYASERSIVVGMEQYRKLKEREQALKTDFHEYLAKILREELIRKAINEVDNEGYPDHNRIFEIAMETINDRFFEHLELRLSDNKSFVDVKESCSSFVATLIEHSCKRMNVLETREAEILEIAIDTGTLANITPEQLQEVTFEVNLRNFQISRMETENGVMDCIIPAGS